MPLLLTHAAQLLTLAGPDRARRGAEAAEIGLVRDGAVLIAGGKIVAAGAHDAVARQAKTLREVEEIDCRGKLVAPGLVDSHTHLVFPAPRLDDFERRLRGESYAALAAAGGGIAATVRALRACDDAGLAAAARAHLLELRAFGVTTAEVKSGYGLSRRDEPRSLAAVAAAGDTGVETVLTYLGAHAVPPEFAGRRADYVALAAGPMLDDAVSAAGVEFADVFCDQGAFSPAEAEAVLRAAQARGLKLKLHAEQLAWTGATQLAVRLGAVPADHAALAAAPTVATLLPGCALFLGTPFPPARALIAAGAAVALASDFNPGTCPISNLPLIMGVACTQTKMSPAEVWTAVTIPAAAALARADSRGSLASGKRADVSIFGTDDYRAVPYFMGANLCEQVIAAGCPRTTCKS